MFIASSYDMGARWQQATMDAVSATIVAGGRAQFRLDVMRGRQK